MFYEANFKFIFIHENIAAILIHMLNASNEEGIKPGRWSK